MVFQESFVRFLSEPPEDDENNVEGESGEVHVRGRYEFVAFILWYMAMILCCIVPTCCAYRRRRRLTRELNSQRRRSMEMFWQSQQELTAREGIETATTMIGSNGSSRVFILSALENLDGDAAVEERRKRLEVAMKEETFVLEEGDIINAKNSDNNVKSKRGDEYSQENKEQKSDRDESDDQGKDEKDIEQGAAVDMDETNTELRLPVPHLKCSTELNDPKQEDPSEKNNTRNETVPGVCAICLCSYEVGDRVTYSQRASTSLLEQDVEGGASPPVSRCPHAFHTDCIVQWLAKKNEARPECPCCRRSFCSVVPLTTADLITARVAGTTSSTAVTSRTTIPMSIMHQFPMIALPLNNDNSNSNSNSGESEQRMMVILPTPDMVAFHERASR